MAKIDWKHIAIGLGMAIGVPAVHFLMGVDWSSLGVYAPIIGGALSFANEILTGAKGA